MGEEYRGNAMISLDEVRAATGIDAFTLDKDGRVRLPVDMSISDKKRALKTSYRVYRSKDTAWRFMLGNIVNDLRLPYGEKKFYCLSEFGEQMGRTVYGYARTAGHWIDVTQEYNWPWSFYKYACCLPEDLKWHLIEQHKNRLLDIRTCEAFCQKWAEEEKARKSTGFSSEAPDLRSSTLVSSSTKYVELSEVLKAVRHVASRRDALQIQNALQCRFAEFDIDDEEADDFADSE
jgi:hypothetical protein